MLSTRQATQGSDLLKRSHKENKVQWTFGGSSERETLVVTQCLLVLTSHTFVLLEHGFYSMSRFSDGGEATIIENR
jgi:hypothetical protein